MYSTLVSSAPFVYLLLNTGVVKRVGIGVDETMTSKCYLGMSLVNGAITIHTSSKWLLETVFNYLKKNSLSAVLYGF